MKCIEADGTRLYWVNTPWDEGYFSLKTIEIVKVENETMSGLQKCLRQLSYESKGELFYGRFRVSNQNIKEAFHLSSYYIAEVSASVYLGNLHSYKLPDIYEKRLVKVDELGCPDGKFIKEKIGESFKYSRFHEDYNLDNRLCEKRMAGWVDQLLETRTSCFVYRSKSKLHSFMFYSVNSGEVSLILGGCLKGSELHAPFFWASVIDEFQKLGFKKIRTRVSLANSGVLSLYQRLGFKINDVQCDYHKLMEGKNVI